MNKKLTKDTIFRVLLSIALAFLLWAFAVTNTDPLLTQKYSSIPIVFQNSEVLTANNLMIESSLKSIDVKLYGRTVQVSKIKSSDIEAVVDLSKITTEGTYTLEVLIKGIPNNVNVVEINPRYITVDVSKITEKKSNFKIELKGVVESGYAILSHSENIDYVEVNGSEAATSQIAEIKGVLDINGKNKDFTSFVNLYAYDKNGKKIENVSLSPTGVSSSVIIGITKTVDLSISSTGTCSAGFAVEKITLDPTQITIAGKSEVIKNITLIPTENVDITNTNSSFSKAVNIITPNDVLIISDSVITANVSIQAYSEQTFTYNTLQVRNIPAGMSCDLSAFTNLNMTVQGFTNIINSLNKDSIKIYIDLNGLNSGTQTVDILYELPLNISVKSMSITKVNIILTPQ